MGWLKKRLPKKRWKRVCVYILSAVAILVAGDMVLVQYWRRIEISLRTTRITASLGADGLPDYVSARNAEESKRVTAENNAAPELLAITAVDQLDYMDWLKAHAPQGADYDAEWEETVRKPWKSREHPDRVAWLNSRRELLGRLDTALQKERFYVAWNSASPGENTAALLPWLSHVRACAHLLAADAMRAVGDGDTATFRRDVLNIAKLARLVGQGSTLIEYLVGLAIEDLGSSTMERGAGVRFLRGDEARALVKEWCALPAMPDGSRVLDEGERFFALSTFCKASRIGLRSAMGGPGSANSLESLFVPVHYNGVLEAFNRYFDEVVAAARVVDYPKRKDAVETVIAESGHRHWWSIGDALVAVAAPAIGRTFVLQERVFVGRDLATVSLGLRAYREEHGGFPERLGELSPGILAEVPGDGFADGPLNYRREGKGYVLYSVGEDGQDDGGVERKDRKNGGGYDIVVRGEE